MNYWIFQNNQVLGPYGPETLSELAIFTAESLVCPEGRKGTSMGDWQRAGMVPDLSVALVKAAQTRAAKAPVAVLAGPPEPSIKELAVLGSLQEKLGSLEGTVQQLQDHLRSKDAELSRLQQEMVAREQKAPDVGALFKKEADELRREAEQFKQETEERRREAELFKSEAEELKRKVTALEERLGTVHGLRESLGKAVESEKNVKQDVQSHTETLAELTQEIESLRTQLRERPQTSTPAPIALESTAVFPPPAAVPTPPMPTLAPAVPTPAPAVATPVSSIVPSAVSLLTPRPTSQPVFDPLSSPSMTASLESISGSVDTRVPTAKTSPRKKSLLLIVSLSLAVLVVLAYVSSRSGSPDIMKLAGLGTKEAPPTPAPTPAAAPTASVAPAAIPPATPTPPAEQSSPSDPRDIALQVAKTWTLADGRTLEQVLETLAPATGALSPWMAELLSEGHAQVNYFARAATPGAPTMAYEFEVDLAAKSVSGRNAAAKGVLAGKPVTPPQAPARRAGKKKVKLPKPKKAPLKAKKTRVGAAPAAPSAAAVPKKSGEEDVESLLLPGSSSSAKAAAHAAPTTPPPTEEKASDEALLDDLLKE